MKFGAYALPLCLLAGLSGCMPFSNYETVTVQTTAGTTPVAGAQCTLNDKNGTWIVTTPGSVSVHLGSEQLGVKCTKDGYLPATQKENSSVNVPALLIDGPIISTVSAAAWTYPQMIKVNMQPEPASPSAINSQHS